LPLREWFIRAAATPAESIPLVNVPPLIGVAATKTSNDRKTGRGLSLHGRTAYRTRRRAVFTGRTIQPVDFVRCPEAKKVPLRIIAAPEFLSLATDRALGVQIVIAAMELMQFELEWPVVVRTSDHAVLPELLHDPMCLFC